MSMNEVLQCYLISVQQLLVGVPCFWNIGNERFVCLLLFLILSCLVIVGEDLCDEVGVRNHRIDIILLLLVCLFISIGWLDMNKMNRIDQNTKEN